VTVQDNFASRIVSSRTSIYMLFTLQCYALLSPSATFSLFHSERKTYGTFSENVILHLSQFLSVCRTDLMALDRFLDLFAHRVLCFSSISFCFSYSYMRQTKLASSLLNF